MANESAPPHLYLSYGPELHPAILASRLGGHVPISSQAVQVPSAVLSWDVVGVPWLEPCTATAMIKGVNDGEWEKLAAEKEQAEDGYDRWLWSRAAPGVEFTGEPVPPLEGVVHELSASGWQHILATNPPKTSLVRINCVPLKTDGDPSINSPSIDAYLPISTSPRAPNLAPTEQYLRLNILGAFLSVTSREYLSHLALIQPFDQKAKRGMRRLVQLALLPAFLLLHLPLRLVKRALGIDLQTGIVRRAIVGAVGLFAGAVQELSFGGLGSGFRNEPMKKKS